MKKKSTTEQERERENLSYLPTLENTLPIITAFAAILAENEKSRETGDGGVVHRSKKTAHIYTAHAKYQSNDCGVSHHGNQGYM